MTSLARFVNVYGKTGFAVAVAFASVCLAAGCTDGGLIDDGSASAAPAEVSDAPTVGESTAPTATATPVPPVVPVLPSLPTAPDLPTLDDVLAEERLVPLAFALERSGFDDLIDGLDEFLLLAPTESAFATGGVDVGLEYSKLMDTPPLLDAFLRYQIVADPSTNESWRTLNGAALDVEGAGPNSIDRVNGVDVIERIRVRGGTVLVMPRLLLPASQPVGAQPPAEPVGSQPAADD